MKFVGRIQRKRVGRGQTRNTGRWETEAQHTNSICIIIFVKPSPNTAHSQFLHYFQNKWNANSSLIDWQSTFFHSQFILIVMQLISHICTGHHTRKINQRADGKLFYWKHQTFFPCIFGNKNSQENCQTEWIICSEFLFSFQNMHSNTQLFYFRPSSKSRLAFFIWFNLKMDCRQFDDTYNVFVSVQPFFIWVIQYSFFFFYCASTLHSKPFVCVQSFGNSNQIDDDKFSFIILWFFPRMLFDSCYSFIS